MSPYAGPERRTEALMAQDEFNRCIRKERRKIYLRLAAIAAILLSVWVTSFQGRHNLVVSQRAGCERGKLDRSANAAGWRIAEGARRQEGATEVADKYARIAAGLERRARVDCAKVFHDPGPFAFR